MHTVRHETIQTHMKSNILFCGKTVKHAEKEKGVFLVGSENKLIDKMSYDSKNNIVAVEGTFSGHHGSIKSVAVSPDLKYMLSASGDQSLRLWSYETYEPLKLFSGHRDQVVSLIFLYILL